MDMIIITPEPGRHAEIGQRLLEVLKYMGLPAGTLQWVTWPTAGYLVPADIYQAFAEIDVMADADSVEPVAPPKKRGRPRRPTAEDADDTLKEE